MCEEQAVEGETSQEVLLDLLHDLGLVIHFKALKHLQTQVLNPRWITQGIYALITSKELTQQGGLLTEAEAETILKTKVTHYSYQNKVHFLMQVMEQFELCYCIGEPQTQYLIPSLLPVELAEEPHDLKGEAIRFIYKYEGFMPPQVMPRFIVKSHKDIVEQQRWRSGVILANNDLASKAKVVADAEEGEISITVVGEQRRDFFVVIRHHFNDIHNSYDQDHLGLKLQVGGLSSRVDYHRLIKLEQRFLAGKHDGQDYDETTNTDFSVVDVLNGLASSQTRQAETEKMNMGKADRNPSININVSPSMIQSNNQQQASSQQVSQEVSISIEIKSLSGKLENWADDLLDDLPVGEDKQGIEKEVGKVQKALEEIKSIEEASQAEEKMGKFERVQGFITDTIGDSNYP